MVTRTRHAGRLFRSLSKRTSSSLWRRKETATFPSLTRTYTAILIYKWYRINRKHTHTPTSIYMLTPTEQTVLSTLAYRSRTLSDDKSHDDDLSFSGTFSGETNTATEISNGFSNHQTGMVCKRRSPLRSHFLLRSAGNLIASAVCYPGTSSPWACN
jgi:hypothetical protein